MRLGQLRPNKGAVKKHKRLGCGTGSGHGATSTRGHKGQKARAGSGAVVPSWFEGGQMPLQRRLPKRGFTAFDKKSYQIVNLEALVKLDKEITPELLQKKGLVKSKALPVKILGQGKLTAAVNVKAHAFSASAKKAIEEAGGKAELLGSKQD
jgi:large subunit ribosomal protein L15